MSHSSPFLLVDVLSGSKMSYIPTKPIYYPRGRMPLYFHRSMWKRFIDASGRPPLCVAHRVYGGFGQEKGGGTTIVLLGKTQNDPKRAPFSHFDARFFHFKMTNSSIFPNISFHSYNSTKRNAFTQQPSA
jgi:hypothetical protein